jgi:hypothetical protein
MAKRIVGIPLEPNGPVILAAVDEADAFESEDAFARAAKETQLDATGRSMLEALDAVITPTARVMMERLKELSPDSVQLEFGLSLVGKAGLVFASAEAEGHFSVKMSWAQTS